jgi:hypothetical protein
MPAGPAPAFERCRTCQATALPVWEPGGPLPLTHEVWCTEPGPRQTPTKPDTVASTLNLDGLDVTLRLAYDENGDVIAVVAVDEKIAHLDPIDGMYAPRVFVVRDYR